MEESASKKDDRKVKLKKESAYVIQASERIEDAEEMEWHNSRSCESPPWRCHDNTSNNYCCCWSCQSHLLLGWNWPNHFWFWMDTWLRNGTKTLKGLRSGWMRTLKRDAKGNLTTKTFLLLQTFYTRIRHPCSHFSLDLSKSDDKLEVFQILCKAQIDGSTSDPVMSELWWCFDSTVARQVSVQNHHDENSRRTRKSFQRIQEEDRGTVRNDEEGCHGACPSCHRSMRKASKGT